MANSIDGRECIINVISLNCGGLYMGSSDWVQNKKATINPRNNADSCFQYPVTVLFNQAKIIKDPQRT